MLPLHPAGDRAAYGLARALLEHADIDGVDELRAAAQHDADDLGEPTMSWMSGVPAASFAALRGDLDLAEHQADDARVLGQRAGHPDNFLGSAIC